MATARKESSRAKKLDDNALAHLAKNSRLSGRLGRAVDRELKARNMPAALIPAGHADSPGVAPDEPWIERRGENITFLHGPTDDAVPVQSELTFGAGDPVKDAEGDAAPDVHNIVLSGHGDADIRPDGNLHEIPENSLGMNFYTPLGGLAMGGSNTTSELLAQGDWRGLRRDYREHYAPGRFVPQHTLNPLTAAEALRLGNVTNARGYVRPGKNVTVVRVAKTTPLADILEEVQQRFPDKKLLFHWGACRSDATQGKLVDSNGKEIASTSGLITAKTGGIFEFSGQRSPTSRFIAGRSKINPGLTPKPAIAPAVARSELAAQQAKAVRVDAARKDASAKAVLDLLESSAISVEECESRLAHIYPGESEVLRKKDRLAQVPLILLLGGHISEPEYESRLSLIYPGKSERHEKKNKLRDATWQLLRSGKISGEQYQARVRKSIMESIHAEQT